MLDNFLVRAYLAVLGVALASAPLGCFVVWRRMAYFGDSTAHAALLAVALYDPIMIDVFVVALVIALLVSTITRAQIGGRYPLGVLSHSMLAIGLL